MLTSLSPPPLSLSLPPSLPLLQSLTKPPSDYPDKKALPHVQVALRMQSRNQHVQPGDVIPYIMCKVSEFYISAYTGIVYRLYTYQLYRYHNNIIVRKFFKGSNFLWF